jgi:hypothetical protein
VRNAADEAPPPGEEGQASWSRAPVLKGTRTWRNQPSTLVFIATAAITIAIVKPWGVASPPPAVPGATQAAHQGVPSSSGRAAPSPRPVIADPNAMICLTHQLEQVLTLERWDDREIKSWSPPTGSSPAGAEGGGVTIASSHVVGIGVCPGIGAATDGGSAPGPSGPARDPVAWLAAIVTDVRVLAPDGTHDLGAPPRITVESDYIAAGVLYGAPDPPVGTESAPPSPPGAPGAALRFWPSGRYVITYYFPGDPTREMRSVVVNIRRPLNDG